MCVLYIPMFMYIFPVKWSIVILPIKISSCYRLVNCADLLKGLQKGLYTISHLNTVVVHCFLLNSVQSLPASSCSLSLFCTYCWYIIFWFWWGSLLLILLVLFYPLNRTLVCCKFTSSTLEYCCLFILLSPSFT